MGRILLEVDVSAADNNLTMCDTTRADVLGMTTSCRTSLARPPSRIFRSSQFLARIVNDHPERTSL